MAENIKIIKLDLDEKRIGSKPLSPEDCLTLVRKKIINKVKKESYNFLDMNGKKIEEDQEKLYKLKDIIVNDNIIKLESAKEQTNLRIILNNTQEYFSIFDKNEKLNELRNSIKNIINQNFCFLDEDENEIEIEDELYYTIKDILNKKSNDLIKIVSSSFKDAPPVELNKPNNKQTPEASKQVEEKSTDLEYYKFYDPTPTKNNYICLNKISNIISFEKEQEINKIVKKILDFNKYEFYGYKKDLKIYKYSKLEAQKPFELVHLHYYDKFIMEYDEENAYVILFCGKTGDGKTTAINALFNIIKGIKMEDKSRFILIDEPKKLKGQAESQTDLINLYFIKDYTDKPVIIIDSPGFVDTRGIKYDQKINEGFNYVFSSLITHINAACFIVKATDARITCEIQYTFNSVTSLFAEDILGNFIIVATHADKKTMDNQPAFIESIQTENFMKIKNKMGINWWYSFDSECILDNDNDRLTKYSFENAEKLYEEKIKKLEPKSIINSSEVLKKRFELKAESSNLLKEFQKLLNNQKLEKLRKASIRLEEI